MTSAPELERNSMDSMKESKVESGITNYDLTIGVTFSDLGFVERFLKSMNEIVYKWPGKIRLVSCLHGLNSAQVDSIIQDRVAEGVDIAIYDEESAFHLARDGALGPWFNDEKSMSGVSWGRCVLHRRILDEIGKDERPVIWILDEDMLLDMSESGLSNQLGAEALIQAISYMEKESIDVGIGSVIGDPPVHPLFTSRTQLLDLYYSELSADCAHTRIDWSLGDKRDIHYDLSTDRFDHLEFPWGCSESNQVSHNHCGRLVAGNTPQGQFTLTGEAGIVMS